MPTINEILRAKLWSILPNAIKECKSLKSFSDKVKTHFLNLD